MMKKVFVDSSFWKAYIDPKDDFHSQAKKILAKVNNDNTTLITSNYIIDETFTLIRVRCGLERAKQLYQALYSADFNLEIVRVLTKDDAAAWKWFWKEWKDLSFTDCVSFALMERLELKEVLAFDSHFSQAGMKIVE